MKGNDRTGHKESGTDRDSTGRLPTLAEHRAQMDDIAERWQRTIDAVHQEIVVAEALADGGEREYLEIDNGEDVWDLTEEELEALVEAGVDVFDSEAVDEFLADQRTDGGDGDE